MRYYAIGGFGRALCLLLLATVLAAGSTWPRPLLAAAVLTLWTAYALVSGIVAVPYNDIVARAVSAERRSRLLAMRFFGGGVLALAAAAAADRMLAGLSFPASYAAIVAMAAVLMLVSAGIFVAMGEPDTVRAALRRKNFAAYLADGSTTFRHDRRFRQFVMAQWCGGAVLIAMPFYVVHADASGLSLTDVAWLLGSQTAGALASNALWGWWGDRHGKASLLRGIAFGRLLPPTVVLLLPLLGDLGASTLFPLYAGLFFVIGALGNGVTIAVLGYLMQISPPDRRPSYSGYHGVLVAPAFLFPLLGGAIAGWSQLSVVFALSLVAAAAQFALLLGARDDS